MSIKHRLENSSIYVIATYATVIIFLLYTCCYAFRKPFTVGLYEGEDLWGIDLKIFYVFSEILGYALSKIVGTYILPSMKKHQRVYYVVGLLGFSELAWLTFGFLPVCLKGFSVFLSGLPLGMIWGIVFSFVEGRRISEVLNCGLSIATIVASGLVKTMAQALEKAYSIPEYWVPFVSGAVIFPLVLICAYLLNQIPEPTEADKLRRSERFPMNGKEKKAFFRKFLGGICLLLLLYGSLTVFREIRDSFAADIWKEFNIDDPLIFTRTEYPIAFAVLAFMFTNVFIRNNRKALYSIYAVSFVGGIVLVGSTIAYLYNLLDPVLWMTFSGLGMYMAYIPFTYMIERLFASLQITATAVFLIYLADSSGYVGTVVVFIIKNFYTTDVSWSNVLVYTSFITATITVLSIAGIYIYFNRRLPKYVKE